MIDVNEKSLTGYKFIDLFCGIGGFRLALESLGATCVFSSEINPDAGETYYNNFGEFPSGDITLINEKDIPEHDIVCAGFPCQAFSASGKKLGFEDARGTLFFDVARIVKEKRPKVVFLENVMFFTLHDEGRTLQVVKNTLEELGYNFFYDILNAADYGVPQQRKRTYMVAFRSDLGINEFHFPYPAPLFTFVKDIMFEESEETKRLEVKRDFYPPRRRQKVRYNDIKLDYFFGKAGQGERVYSSKGSAITVSTTNKGIYSVPGADGTYRRLLPREIARLMGFPDSYQLHKTDKFAYHQLGNSVVVDVIQYIAISICRALHDEPEELRLTSGQ